METNGALSGPDTARREYRHTRRARTTGVLIAACGVLFAVGFIGLLLALFLGSDLSYMQFWPWWFRVFFWITLASFPGGISALYLYIGLRQLALVRRHREDVAIADHEGLTLIQGGVSVHFPWEQVSIDRPAPLITRLRAGGQERFVMGDMREVTSGQALAGELAAHLPERRERKQRLHAGERIPVVEMRSQKPLFILVGAYGALLILAPLIALLVDALETAVTHEPPSEPRGPGGALVSLAGIAFVLAGWGLLSLSPRRSGLQFTPEEWRYWNWLGRLRAIPYPSILSVQWKPRPRAIEHANLRITYADPGARGGQRRLSFSTDTFWSTDTLAMLRDELVSHAGLVPSPENAQLWVRSEVRGS